MRFESCRRDFPFLRIYTVLALALGIVQDLSVRSFNDLADVSLFGHFDFVLLYDQGLLVSYFALDVVLQIQSLLSSVLLLDSLLSLS